VDARADQLRLPGHPETPVGGAGRDQHRLGADALTSGEAQDGVRPIRLEPLDRDRRQHLHPVAPRLGDEPLRQLGAPDALWEAGVVVHSLRDARLPAERAAVDDQGADPLACRVDGGGEPRRPASDDGEVIGGAIRLQLESEAPGQVPVQRSQQMVPSGKRMVGIVRPPFCSCSTKRSPSGSSSMSTQLKGTRCSARNFFDRLQSGHHGAP
jgi:hypothetical protein